MSASAAGGVAEFDVLNAPLDGVQLVEASAGTGKTWNLSALYLRLLLERDLPVSQLLVVTFTVAATDELRDRIRARLQQTLAHVAAGGIAAAPPPGTDPFVPKLVERLLGAAGVDISVLEQRLERALQTFDEASIHTIHAWAQRALGDAPFAARQPLALEATTDDRELRLQVAADLWRRLVAAGTLPPRVVGHLLARGDGPETWAALLKRHAARPLARVRWPDGLGTDPPPDDTRLVALHAQLRGLWPEAREALPARVLEAVQARHLKANQCSPKALQEATDAWAAALAGDDPLGPVPHQDRLELLTAAGLAQRTSKAGVTPRHDFLEPAEAWLAERQRLQRALARARLALMRELLVEGDRAVREAKRQARVVSFDDMLRNLHEALHGPQGEALAAALRQRHPVALIDEFQDTDPLQWGVVARLYADAGLTLVLVGDPKQAIYSFRHADLHTYLLAKQRADRVWTLSHNQRSSAALVAGVNRLALGHPNAFMQPGIGTQPARMGAKPRAVFEDTSGGPDAALQLWQLPGVGEALAGRPGRAGAAALAVQAAAAGIARLLEHGAAGRVRLDGRPLRAGDVAVLVRTHRQGRLVRDALAAWGVGSVELGQASVWATAEAMEVERLLQAVLDPGRDGVLRAALATELLGGTAATLERLTRDEQALLPELQRFARWRARWLGLPDPGADGPAAGPAHGHGRGVGAMLRQVMAEARVTGRLLARPDGERRLTNLLHLAELLQQAASEHPNAEALLRRVAAQRRDALAGGSAAEESQLRLESDRHLVQIVTVHKSKGLEYPVVVCPFLWEQAPRAERRGAVALDGALGHDDDGTAVIDYRVDLDEPDPETAKARRRQVAAERVRAEAEESLRLVYVALTRAVHRCIVVVGPHAEAAGRNLTARPTLRSTLHWLVAGRDRTPDEWLEDGAASLDDVDAAWAAFAVEAASSSPGAVALLPWPAPAVPRPVVLAPEADAPPVARRPPAGWPAPWRLGSYSSLNRGTDRLDAGGDDAEADAAPEAVADRGAGDELDEARPAEVAPPPPAAAAAPRALDDILDHPRGPVAGDGIHAAFERADFVDAATWDAAVAQALAEHPVPETPTLRAQARAAGLEPATLNTRRLRRLLHDVLHTPLQPAPMPLGPVPPVRLADVPPARRVAELAFHLPSRGLDAAALNTLLRGLPRDAGARQPPLAFERLDGWLKGYVDLVFEHDGRWHVLDWKSNHLGETPADYAEAALVRSMDEHRYHLQALLYTLALHRHLRCRLRDYDYDRHVGGALYLYVRGVRPAWRQPDGRPSGVWAGRPTRDVIERLSALFDGALAPARRGTGVAR